MKQITIITKDYHGLTADIASAIAHLAKRLRDADLHIRSMRVVQHHGDLGTIAVSADPIEKARDLVKDELFSTTPAV